MMSRVTPQVMPCCAALAKCWPRQLMRQLVRPGWEAMNLRCCCRGADERGAAAIRDRIQSLVELNNQFYSGQPLGLAMGIACCQSGEAVESALHKADQAMYEEKKRYYHQQGLERRR